MNQTETNDDCWLEVAPEIRRLRRFQPLEQEEVAEELTAREADKLTDERSSEIVDFVASSAVTADPVKDDEKKLTIDRFIEQASSCGLGSVDELRSLVQKDQAESRLRTPREYAEELVRRGAPGSRPLELFADYLLLDAIGQGGMGQVYRAFHLRMDRVVAVKVLRLIAAERDGAQRFDIEVKTLAKLNHPHVVRA